MMNRRIAIVTLALLAVISSASAGERHEGIAGSYREKSGGEMKIRRADDEKKEAGPWRFELKGEGNWPCAEGQGAQEGAEATVYFIEFSEGPFKGQRYNIVRDNDGAVKELQLVGGSKATWVKQNVSQVTVEATKNAVDTGVRLEVGDRVEVTEVTGKIHMNKPATPENATDMEGWTQFKPTDTCLFANATPASLVGYIGDPKSHYQVRKSQYVEAKVAGSLFFAINDQPASYADNSGEFVVSYKIIKKELIRSRDLGGTLNINWVNKTGVPITVNWIDQDGKEVPSANGVIQPDKIFDGATHVGHIFRVRDDKNVEICLIEVEATSEKVNIQK